MSAFQYGTIFLGIVGVLSITGARTGDMPEDGPIDTYFVHSRDGREWKFTDDNYTPIIPRGNTGTFDGGMILGTAKEPLLSDISIDWYYTGSSNSHGAALENRRCAIGKASWRLDGFVSLHAANVQGKVETKPLFIPKGQLELNADASLGTIMVEVLGEYSNVQPGFSAKNCIQIKTDSLHHQISWAGKKLTSAKLPLRFRFLISNADLYAFRIRADETSKGY